ncbi:hypothetical protein L2E82_02660 [Cichorium intybus]|uniref:Uncharacterized protein n=1 Tax=Cichorium intybus TaxID=13427 RepID=A0ACB9H3G3_CICIN|nr:hypothetical protein L2E82_02660 [Cichorium intybus]
MAILFLLKQPFFLYIILVIMFPGMVKAYMTDSDALLRIKKSLNSPEPLDGFLILGNWEHSLAMIQSVFREIPAIGQRGLDSVNLSYNNLTGEIPLGLIRFDVSSFEGNPGLCGPKFGKACENKTLKAGKTVGKPSKKSLRIEYVLMVVSLIILVLMVETIE